MSSATGTTMFTCDHVEGMTVYGNTHPGEVYSTPVKNSVMAIINIILQVEPYRVYITSYGIYLGGS